MANNEVTATLRLQVKEEVTSQMRRARDEMEKLQRSSDRTKGFVKDLFRELAGPAAGVGAAAAFAAFVKGSVEAASNLEGLENRARIIFGESFPRMQQEAEKLAGQLHRSSSDVLGYASDLETIFRGAGMAGRATEEMSLALASLSADFGSFFRISDADAFEVIRGAVVGQTRALTRLGVVMNENTLQAFALSKGIKTQVSDMSEAQMMTLRYNFLMEKTQEIQGDAARSTNTLAGQMKELSAQWQDFMETAGTPLLGVFAQALAGVNELLGSVGQSISALKMELVNLYTFKVNEEKGFGTRFQDGIAVRDYARPEFRQANETGVYKNVQNQVKQLNREAEAGAKDWQKYWNSMGGAGGGGGSADKAKEKLKQITEAMEDLGRSYGEASRTVSRSLKEMEKQHRESMEAIRDDIQKATDDLLALDEAHQKALSGFVEDRVSAAAEQGEKVEALKKDLDELTHKAGALSEDMITLITNFRKASDAGKELTGDEIHAFMLSDDQVKQFNILLKLKKEQAALDAFRSANPDIAKSADEKASLTAFEEEMRRIDRRQSEESAEYAKRRENLEAEMGKLQEKQALEERVYGALRQQYADTQAALAAWVADHALKMNDLKSVTEETAKAMKQSLEDIRNSVSRVDAEVQGSSDFGRRVQERRNARQVPALAEGGIVTRPTLALIGEAGPEAVVPLSRAGGVGDVTNHFGPFYISKEVDVDSVIRQITRAIQKQQLQAA